MLYMQRVVNRILSHCSILSILLKSLPNPFIDYAVLYLRKAQSPALEARSNDFLRFSYAIQVEPTHISHTPGTH